MASWLSPRARELAFVSALVYATSLLSFYVLSTTSGGVSTPIDSWVTLPSGAVRSRDSSERTLVVYAYFENELNDYRANAEFFLDVGLAPSELARVDYVVVLSGPHTLDAALLAQLKSRPNVLVVSRDNACYDFGSHGAGLEAATRWRGSLGVYRYFVFVNSSVRGPFMPVYASWLTHWTHAFTDRLSDVVKLVGTTINCQPTVGGQWPHVQSMVFATDTVGLAVLERAGVFECARMGTLLETIVNGEVGSSRAIFQAGYSIDCLMYRYAGVDWRVLAAQHVGCNRGHNPTLESRNDGVSVHPFETVFVKAKRGLRSPFYNTVERLSAAVRARDLKANRYLDDELRHVREDVRDADVRAANRCGLVFDWAFYAGMNADVAAVVGRDESAANALYENWRDIGFCEPRFFRWTIPADARGRPLSGECAALTRSRFLEFPYKQ